MSERLMIGNFLYRFIDRASELVPADYSQLIIVTGPPRSGTTWLQREICGGPNMYSFLPECTLLTQQVELYSRTLQYSDPQRFNAYFANKQNLLSYYRSNVRRLINQVATLHNRPNSKILVLKDPGISLYLNETQELFPKHKLVALVRDPRDVLASMKKVTARKQADWRLQDAATQLFSYYYQIGSYAQQANKNFIVLRYEDLVAGKVDPLRSFLRLPVLQDMVHDSEIAAMRDQLSVADPFFSDLYLQPTTSKAIGSYKQILTSEESSQIEAIYSGVIHRWAY